MDEERDDSWEEEEIAKSGTYTRWSANLIRPAITAYCSILQSHLERYLWVKDLNSCKMMTPKRTSKFCQKYIKSKKEPYVF